MNGGKGFVCLCFLLLNFGVKAASKSDLLVRNTQKVADAYHLGVLDDMIEPIYYSFELDTILPNDMSFYYGVLMHHYKNGSQAKQSLIKYLKLTGREGQYYEDALRLLGSLYPGVKEREYLPRNAWREELLRQEKQPEDIPLGVENAVPCNGGEFAVCPVCVGEGVKITSGSFGKVYRTCPRCQGKGVVKCKQDEGE